MLKCCSLIVFLQIAGNVNLANGEGLDVSSEGELVEKLLSNYHKHGRPVLDVIVVSKSWRLMNPSFIVQYFNFWAEPLPVVRGSHVLS